jgi:hypothetical protein
VCKATKNWLYNKRDVFLCAAIFCIVWYFALWSSPSQEFITSMASALAWPVVLLILVGYRYRRPLEELIGRIQQFGGLGITVKTAAKAYDDDQAQELVKKLDSPDTDAKTKERLRKLLALSLDSLRLLGELAAVGTRQQLDLTLYTENSRRAPAFREAIEQLLEQSLITRPGRWYRPTLEGIEVLRLHLNTIQNEVDPRT